MCPNPRQRKGTISRMVLPRATLATSNSACGNRRQSCLSSGFRSALLVRPCSFATRPPPPRHPPSTVSHTPRLPAPLRFSLEPGTPTTRGPRLWDSTAPRRSPGLVESKGGGDLGSGQGIPAAAALQRPPQVAIVRKTRPNENSVLGAVLVWRHGGFRRGCWRGGDGAHTGRRSISLGAPDTTAVSPKRRGAQNGSFAACEDLRRVPSRRPAVAPRLSWRRAGGHWKGHAVAAASTPRRISSTG